MAQTAAATPISGPASVAYDHGLFSVVTAPNPDDPAWESFGVRWPYAGEEAEINVINDPCVDPDTPLPERSFNACLQQWANAMPFTLEFAGGGSGVGLDTTPEQAARDALIQREQVKAEAVVWNMLSAQHEVPTADDVVDRIAALEQSISTDFGSSPVIHMGRSTAIKAAAQNLISVQGGQLRTVLGSRVVAGGGYDTEMTGVVAATTEVLMLRSEIQLNVGVYDTSINSNSILASRTYLFGWSAARVTVTA